MNPYNIHYATGADGDPVEVPQLQAGESPMLATQDVQLPAAALGQFVPLGPGYAPWAAGDAIVAITAYAKPAGARRDAVYTAGCFNIDAIAWPASTTEAQVQAASETGLLKFRKLLYSQKRTGTEPAPGTTAGP